LYESRYQGTLNLDSTAMWSSGVGRSATAPLRIGGYRLISAVGLESFITSSNEAVDQCQSLDRTRTPGDRQQGDRRLELHPRLGLLVQARDGQEDAPRLRRCSTTRTRGIDAGIDRSYRITLSRPLVSLSAPVHGLTCLDVVCSCSMPFSRCRLAVQERDSESKHPASNYPAP